MNTAVIGGGFSGMMTAINLATQFPNHQVTLIEPNPLGLGVAYSTPYDYHLLNVPAGKMSAFPDKDDHFVNWLRQNPELLTASKEPLDKQFIARATYGKYLQSIINESQQYLSNLVCLTDEVMNASKIAKQWTLQFANHKNLSFDHIVLALGNPQPEKSWLKDSHPDWINNPWDWEKVTSIEPNQHVLILGTSLTMIDVVLSLVHHQHEGPITALSRHGFLPQAHDDLNLPPLPFESHPERLAEWIKYLRAKIQAAPEDWRAIVDGLRPMTQAIWFNFTLREKQQFLRHWRSIWDIHRHRIAKPIAQQIDFLKQSQQLKILAASIVEIDSKSQKICVKHKRRHQPGTHTLTPDVIINCMGPSSDYRKIKTPLIQSLLAQGHIKPCALKLGLDAAPTGQTMNQANELNSTLWTVGPPTKGVLWEIIAVPDIKHQALNLARQIGSFEQL